MARSARVTAKLRLAEGKDGAVQFQVLTSRRLESFHRRTWAGWDSERQEHLWEDHGLERPEDYLREPSTFGFMVSGPERDKWRYVEVRAGAPLDGLMHPLVHRALDLSEGSEERRLLALLVEQESIPVVWVNEGVAVSHPYTDALRASLRLSLENTAGVSPKDWKEELAELAWRSSPSWRPGPRPRPYKQRRRPPPDMPVPFFAPCSGRIPRARGAEVAGVRLPAGRRYPPGLPAAYWGSLEPLLNAEVVAGRIAAAFAETGLWPLLWRNWDDPGGYLGGHGDLDAVDDVDVGKVMSEAWARVPWPPGSVDPFTDFPGLAPPSGHKALQSDPFPALAPGGEHARLLLVPCNRPADAVTMLGGLGGVVEAPVISAVLRSWEERFSATAYEVAPDLVVLAVASPPQSEQALLVAAEHMAFCPPDESGVPGALRKVAEGLLTPEVPAAESYRSSRERWYVGWAD